MVKVCFVTQNYKNIKFVQKNANVFKLYIEYTMRSKGFRIE